jgi:hypothetical protein
VGAWQSLVYAFVSGFFGLANAGIMRFTTVGKTERLHGFTVEY